MPWHATIDKALESHCRKLKSFVISVHAYTDVPVRRSDCRASIITMDVMVKNYAGAVVEDAKAEAGTHIKINNNDEF